VADYKEILNDKSIDAVVIATPEHLHHRHAARRPCRRQARLCRKAALAHHRRGAGDLKVSKTSKSVVQVGTQNRSNSLYQMAKTMIEQGVIGKCHYTRAFWYRNALPTGAAPGATRSRRPERQTADWERFLGPAPKREFNRARYSQWRLYWDYSSGIATDLMVHQTDVTAFVMGKGTPSSIIASGGVYRWTENDDRDVPDTWSVPAGLRTEKFHVNYSCYLGNAKFGYGEQFCGNEGTIEVINRSTLNYYPEAFAPGMSENVKERKELSITIPRNDNLAVEAHIRNFLNAIKGKEQAIAPVRAGFDAVVAGLLSVVSYREGKKMLWDSKTDTYRRA
jgi:predicted dehydrogenase